MFEKKLCVNNHAIYIAYTEFSLKIFPENMIVMMQYNTYFKDFYHALH